MIDRESPVPVYYQIQQDLVARISRGEWIVGDQIPSEAALMDEYKVSRVTLRQALAELEKDNLIKRQRGKGAFVTSTNPRPFVYNLNYKLVSGDRVDKNDGDEITAEVIDIKYVTPVYPEIASVLNLKKGEEKAVFIKRVFRLGDRPIAVGRSWLPSHLLPDFVEKGLVNSSLTQTLKKRYNIVPEAVDDELGVIRCNQSDSRHLNCNMDVPLILIKGKSSIGGNTVIEYSETSWLGDYVRFHLHFKLTDSGYVMGN